MGDALLECCCRLVVELLCHIACAGAYGACGAPRRHGGLPLNALEIYVAQPSPEHGDCGSCWMCSRARVLLPEEMARHAVEWGVERASLDELVSALGTHLEKGAALTRCCGGARAAAGVEAFVRSDGARWQARLGVSLQPIPHAPVALRVVLGPRYSGSGVAAQQQQEALPAAGLVVVVAPPLPQQQQPMLPAGGGFAQPPPHSLAPYYQQHAAAGAPMWAPPMSGSGGGGPTGHPSAQSTYYVLGGAR